MRALADLLKQGTDAFNARRAAGELPRDFAGQTLSGLYFASADFSSLDLSNLEIEDCTIGAVDFSGAELTGAYVHGTRFERCDFRRARLEGASFERVEFVDCEFDGAVGLDSVELEDVEGFGASRVGAQVLDEAPRFTPGHVAAHPALEAELEQHPGDEARWRVYADWLIGEGDLRGELINRAGHDDFAAFVDEHLEAIFPGCADELRGGGQQPELVVEWRHGLVVGATLESLNPERRVELGPLARTVLRLPVSRFLERLSFGLISGATRYGERTNDYAEVVAALAGEPALRRVKRLGFGLQQEELGEFDDPEPPHPFGDLSALWPLVPQLRELLVRGSTGVLGEVVLPELRAVRWQLEDPDQLVNDEVLTARHPKLERFELWDRLDPVNLEPLLHVLAGLPLTHLGLHYTSQADVLLERLVDGPLLRRLAVVDLSHALFTEGAFDVLRRNVEAFRHLRRLDLTGVASNLPEAEVSRLGSFIVFEHAQDPEPAGDDWGDDVDEDL